TCASLRMPPAVLQLAGVGQIFSETPLDPRLRAPVSAPAVGRVPEGAQEQRHVEMLIRVAHLEGDAHLGVEARHSLPGEVRAGLERDAVAARDEALTRG